MTRSLDWSEENHSSEPDIVYNHDLASQTGANNTKDSGEIRTRSTRKISPRFQRPKITGSCQVTKHAERIYDCEYCRSLVDYCAVDQEWETEDRCTKWKLTSWGNYH